MTGRTKGRKSLWIPRRVGTATRYHREGGGAYTLRHMMEPAPEGKPRRRKWTLFCGDNRVWDVQPQELLSSAISETENFLAGR